MSTLEIAELTGKRHDNVLADSVKMLEGLGEVGALKSQGSCVARQNKAARCLNLPKRECLIVVSGYSAIALGIALDYAAQVDGGRARDTNAPTVDVTAGRFFWRERA